MGTAILTGISGQDGSYLAEQLREDGHRVVGLLREGRTPCVVLDSVEYAEWDFMDVSALTALLSKLRPSEFYNFAAFSTGAGMYDDPVGIGELNGIAVARMLQAVLGADVTIRFCQASSSEMFGDPVTSPQDELTPFRPCSPYAAAKLFAHAVVQGYRARHGVFACSAILYNHESPRRGRAFVTRKIADAVARIRAGVDHELRLGNLDAKRDWGYAPDYVRALRLMLAHQDADDYVVATGQLHSVREFCELAFSHAGLDYRDWVRENTTDLRQDRRGPIVGDATKARRILGWRPSTDFGALVRLMVDASIASLANKGSMS
ncbi:GDP-mannose 4,6-dehydratase [Dyella nitratireducens]|uniref:GDP-mannose 4,6-dehydratase n=1 Tax=Dyella nitratireducens TaxID=1849580 RepID=A0ABQ1FYP2_9GAMM|nr:GDP-mannose 4,6-dehydratase [Dyella nitratireducens]GGA33357.1 GDP-mannose 4,6-dehydratase [Dyella nitratireducens]GLQ40719.1 GDP-mannose 4,6-dehydratase [Dyella nitratireducens]